MAPWYHGGVLLDDGTGADGDGAGGGSRQCTKVSTKASSLDVTNTQDRCFGKFRRENSIYSGSNCGQCDQDCRQIHKFCQFI